MAKNEEVSTLEEIREALLRFPTSPAFGGRSEISTLGAHIWKKDGKITLRVFGHGLAFNLTFPLDED